MEKIALKTEEIILSYQSDYTIDDEAFYEPFVLLKAIYGSRPAWWNGERGKKKVEKLFEAFKMDTTIKEACVYSGISIDQYKYFCEIHSSFSTIKERLHDSFVIKVKELYIADLLNPDSKYAPMRERYLLRQEPIVVLANNTISSCCYILLTEMMSNDRYKFCENCGRFLLTKTRKKPAYCLDKECIKARQSRTKYESKRK
jgi:hypothetical protein